MTLLEKAEDLNISTHTLRNWQKRNKLTEISRGDLVRRANKLNSSLLSIPAELLGSPENRPLLTGIRQALLDQPLSPEGRILLFSLSYLRFLNLLSFETEPESGASLSRRIGLAQTANVMKEELLLRLNSLNPGEQKSALILRADFQSLFKKSLKKEEDLPGLLYQSLRKEGNRSRQGAWFTPLPVIDAMLRPYLRRSSRLFDPCCGSGLFLCRFAEKKGSADTVRGTDKDPFSVFLTRLNLYCRFPLWRNFTAITEGDSLKDGSWHLGPGELVATNPPWGAHLGKKEKNEMLRRYPGLTSGESASLFIMRCIRELPPGGEASFLLPESLFYVQAHQDIREQLLKLAPPVRITDRGRLFKGVYTAAVGCDFIKDGRHRKVTVENDGGGREKHSLSRYRNNPGRIINYHCGESSLQVIRKVGGSGSCRLPENCRWLLGVVSGDNRRFIDDSPGPGKHPLLTGKEILPFAPAPVRRYLRTDDGPLQQNLPLSEYGVPKLVYRFIGYTPLFAIDREGLITLNSANSLIPPEGWELEELALWYNSALFRFLWFNQYRSVKMLRHHLEHIPLPRWEKKEKSAVRSLVKMAENRQDVRSVMDEMIFRHFNLTEEEIRIVFSRV